MKLNQDQIKKMVAAGMLLALLLYTYFTFLLGPLQQSRHDAAAGIDTLRPQLADAKKQITRTAVLERTAPEACSYMDEQRASIPDGAPIAWFPPKMAQFFRSHGIDKCNTRLLSEGPATIAGFKRIVWAIDLPKVEFVPLGAAISSLENEEPLLSVVSVSIDAGSDQAQYQRASVTVATLVKS